MAQDDGSHPGYPVHPVPLSRAGFDEDGEVGAGGARHGVHLDHQMLAGIGLAVGSGLYFASILTTILTMIALLLFGRMEHAMIRKDWYRTIIIESRESIDQFKAIREILEESRTDITDFEVDRSRDGQNMVLKLGVKLYETRCADQLLKDIGSLDGVKNVKWETE